MMPIFFHIESHLWIVYTLLANGLLIHWLLRDNSIGYQGITEFFEAQLLAAFFISLLLNGTLLFALDMLNKEFTVLKILLPLITITLMVISAYHFTLARFKKVAVSVCDPWRLCLYSLVYIILFYNGGLIEQTSDAWWHMSLANKIGLESSFSLDYGHLTGISGRDYPPLWHGNLALINTLSDIGIPVIWNSFTAWGGVLKVMGFFLLAWSLSRNLLISTLSAFLFILLPGMGDSYLRVSAWPSHIAYTAFFCSLYVIFHLLDLVQREKPQNLWAALKTTRRYPAVISCLLLLLVILTFTHLAELLWLALAMFFYFSGLLIYSTFSERELESAACLWRPFGWLIVIAALLSCAWLLFARMNISALEVDKLLSYFLPVIFLIGLAISQLSVLKRTSFARLSLAQWVVLLVGISLLLSIDGRHLLSLFSSDLAYPKAAYPQHPLVALGWFGGELKVPGWHLQLRQGLLYSGVISLPLSIILLALKPSRLTLFLTITANGAFLFCVSPYLHQWLRDILRYHSSWRIAILIFHPIIISTALVYCWQTVFSHNEGVEQL